jgi:flap endonuclease-1
MGIAFKDLLIVKEINLDYLQNKTLAVDTNNMLYQFLTTIRSRDGTVLTDSHGNTTSHLVGLFSRATSLMQRQIKFIFVFDGEYPALKKKEQERRYELKKEAQQAYEIAKEREDIDSMKKYASRTAYLTAEMRQEAKELITALGFSIIDAPCEGEAQVAQVVKEGKAFAAVSQDYDTLLYSTPFLIRNLSIAVKRKKANTLAYTNVEPELLNLSDNLNLLGIDKEQLIALAMLIGTDYNYGGIHGIGPKKALKLVKEHGHKFEEMFNAVKWNEHFSTSWKEVYETFVQMPVHKNIEIKQLKLNKEDLYKLLCDKHDFSRERVDNAVSKLSATANDRKQKGLGDFF